MKAELGQINQSMGEINQSIKTILLSQKADIIFFLRRSSPANIVNSKRLVRMLYAILRLSIFL